MLLALEVAEFIVELEAIRLVLESTIMRIKCTTETSSLPMSGMYLLSVAISLE